MLSAECSQGNAAMANETGATRLRYLLSTQHSALSTRFPETLDALAPHALAFGALLIAWGGWPAQQSGMIAVIVIALVLAAGTAWRFFRPLAGCAQHMARRPRAACGAVPAHGVA